MRARTQMQRRSSTRRCSRVLLLYIRVYIYSYTHMCIHVCRCKEKVALENAAAFLMSPSHQKSRMLLAAQLDEARKAQARSCVCVYVVCVYVPIPRMLWVWHGALESLTWGTLRCVVWPCSQVSGVFMCVWKCVHLRSQMSHTIVYISDRKCVCTSPIANVRCVHVRVKVSTSPIANVTNVCASPLAKVTHNCLHLRSQMCEYISDRKCHKCVYISARKCQVCSSACENVYISDRKCHVCVHLRSQMSHTIVCTSPIANVMCVHVRVKACTSPICHMCDCAQILGILYVTRCISMCDLRWCSLRTLMQASSCGMFICVACGRDLHMCDRHVHLCGRCVHMCDIICVKRRVHVCALDVMQYGVALVSSKIIGLFGKRAV